MLLAPAKLRWLENNRPADRERVKHVLTIAGWLGLKLTGIPACEPSLAAGIGLLDPSFANRDNTSLSKMGVSSSLLPPLHTSGAVVGKIDSNVARQCGLPPNIAVTLAGADSATGLVGMGLTRPADTALVAGWSTTIQTLTGSPQPDPQAKVWFSPSPIPGRWIAETNLGDAGNAHRWLKNLVLGPDSSFNECRRPRSLRPRWQQRLSSLPRPCTSDRPRSRTPQGRPPLSPPPCNTTNHPPPTLYVPSGSPSPSQSRPTSQLWNAPPPMTASTPPPRRRHGPQPPLRRNPRQRHEQDCPTLRHTSRQPHGRRRSRLRSRRTSISTCPKPPKPSPPNGSKLNLSPSDTSSNTRITTSSGNSYIIESRIPEIRPTGDDKLLPSNPIPSYSWVTK